MQVIGHRGHMRIDGAPENSLAAVVAALGAGADGVEVDVRLTADNVAVCAHDADLRRLAHLRTRVCDLTYAELGRLPLRGGFRLARFVDVANVVGGAGLLIAEIKHEHETECPTTLVSTVLQAISDARLNASDVVVSSFSAAVLADVARLATTVRRALVTSSRIPAIAGLNEVLAWEHHELHAHRSTVLAHPQVADLARQSDRVIQCWDVDRECDARLLDAAGVSGVITDDPSAMKAALLTRRPVPPMAVLPV